MARRQSKSTAQKRPGTSADRTKGSAGVSSPGRRQKSQSSMGGQMAAKGSQQPSTSRQRPSAGSRRSAELEMPPDEEM